MHENWQFYIHVYWKEKVPNLHSNEMTSNNSLSCVKVLVSLTWPHLYYYTVCRSSLEAYNYFKITTYVVLLLADNFIYICSWYMLYLEFGMALTQLSVTLYIG